MRNLSILNKFYIFYKIFFKLISSFHIMIIECSDTRNLVEGELMSQPQRGNESKYPKTNVESDQAIIGELVVCIQEVLTQDLQQEREPFERYAQEVRLRLQGDIDVFRDRLILGHEVLLETLHTMDRDET
jgi:hypothetical protein